MNNSKSFRCISFPINFKHRLNKYLSCLKNKIRHLDNSHSNYLKLASILVVINYVSKFSFEDFDYLRRHGGFLPNCKFHINFRDRMAHEWVEFRNVKLIKHISMFRYKPIFELRINEISNCDFGFRCIFFIPQDVNRRNYQCYVSPFTKSSHRYAGNEKTNQNVIQTNVAYEQYCAKPYNFRDAFTNVNYLINKSVLKEG